MGGSMGPSWSEVVEADDPKAVLEATPLGTLLRFCKLKGLVVGDFDLTAGNTDLVSLLLSHLESELAGVQPGELRTGSSKTDSAASKARTELDSADKATEGVGKSGTSISGSRERAQSGYKSLRDWTEEKKAQKGAAGSAIDTTEKVVSSVKALMEKFGGKAVDKSAELIGLEKYRDELEQLLDEAVRVITVQEVRIARLEEQLGEANT